MKLSEDGINEKHGKQRGHCNRNTFLPYQYQWTCFSSNYNVIKRKQELSKKQRKKTNFINRIKHAELKIFCICVDVYKNFERAVFDKIYEVLSTLKNEKLKNNNILNEK